MKLPFLVLAALLILCGCTAPPESATEPPMTEIIAVTEPVCLYDSSGVMQAQTKGAVKAYPLALSDADAIATMGSHVVLFSGSDATTLTVYGQENLCPAAALTLPCRISPADGAVQVNTQGISYYDAPQKELVFLDTGLKEISRISLSTAISGTPVLSADWEKLYYCTADALRCTDLSTGLDRLVKQMAYPGQFPTALHRDDNVIICDTTDGDGTFRRLYISTRTGQLLYEDRGDVTLHTYGDAYFALHKDGIYTELLTGNSEHGPTLLDPNSYNPEAFPLLSTGGAVTAATDSAGNTRLHYYDLSSGRRTSILTLEGTQTVHQMIPAADNGNVWFLRYDPQYGCDTLYLWELSKSPIPDPKNYLSARYTAENPDYAGLAACRETADALSRRYGVQILLWTDATSYEPWDYTLIPEHQVRVIQENLKELEQFLAMYPQSFLLKAAEKTSSGRIQICLVRSILGKEAGTAAEVTGLQYWDDNRNTYLCLSVAHQSLSRNASHEMSHIIDSRVLTVCKAYDDWNSLNPPNFTYIGSYTATAKNTDWTQGENRAFIDTYSMSYAKEDRARIMEYAMEAENAHYFESDTMQKKLLQLCRGIREAFGLKKSTEVFQWEQYLRHPIAAK